MIQERHSHGRAPHSARTVVPAGPGVSVVRRAPNLVRQTSEPLRREVHISVFVRSPDPVGIRTSDVHRLTGSWPAGIAVGELGGAKDGVHRAIEATTLELV